MYLVRLGGAGAVLPRLLVVRRICTLPLALPPVENVLSLDVVEPVSGSVEQVHTCTTRSISRAAQIKKLQTQLGCVWLPERHATA